MASSGPWTNVCSECRKPVEVLNGDYEFSMNLHKQSHKSLEEVNKHMDSNQRKQENSSRINNKKEVKISNNDVNLSLNLNAQKHKLEKTDSASDHSAASSGRATPKDKCKTKKEVPTTPTSTLESIFHTMPIGLKAHRAFISEKSYSKATCNLCEIAIDPIFSVSEHLKTKLHEDNVIQIIKTLIAAELQDQMEFVSFYGSNLYCNLCGVKIDLCSNNLHETVVNIFSHNAGKGHLSMKSNTKESNQSDKPLNVLKTLALIEPSVKENLNFIEYKMNPFYKCKKCNKVIAFSDNEKELLNNFKLHFKSPGHKKKVVHSDAATILNKWDAMNITGKEHHRFVLAKKDIYCINCSCLFIDPNLEELLAHVRGDSKFYHFVSMPHLNPADQPSPQNAYSSVKKENVQKTGESVNDCRKPKPAGEPLPGTSTKLSEQVKIEDVRSQFNTLLTTNFTIKWNSRYLENEGEGYKCKLCKAVMASGNELKQLEENLMSHISGKKHNKQIAKEFNGILDKMQISNTIQTNRVFLTKNHGGVFCTLCNCTIPSADDVDALIKNITTHLEGTGHSKLKLQHANTQLSKEDKIEDAKSQFKTMLEANPTIKKNSKYLENEGNDYKCRLCKSVLGCGNELKQIEGNIKSHFAGKKHNKQIAKEFNDILDKMQISNTSLQTNRMFFIKKHGIVSCTLCECSVSAADDVDSLIKNITTHLDGTTHQKRKKEESESSASVDLEGVKTNPVNLVVEAFFHLPSYYQKDIEFISVSPIKGYLSCSICNSTIHPCDLKAHLGDLQHLQGKIQAKQPINMLGAQRKNDIGTLNSLVQNINLKSPFQ